MCQKELSILCRVLFLCASMGTCQFLGLIIEVYSNVEYTNEKENNIQEDTTMEINWNDKKVINATIIICSLLLVITAVMF